MLVSRHLGFDLRVGINDDSQEHVEKNEKNEENIKDKVRRTKDAVCPLQLSKLEIAQQNTQLGKPATITAFHRIRLHSHRHEYEYVSGFRLTAHRSGTHMSKTFTVTCIST